MLLKSMVCGALWALTAATVAGSVSAQRQVEGSFDLAEGDRVVFLGNAFFERARYYGHIETALAVGWPEADVTFRNIGWNGDTVGGRARTGGRRGARFGSDAEGFRNLVDHVTSLRPTHLFIAYGFNESFAGQAGLEPFAAQLDRLLVAVASEHRQIILVSPLLMENGFGAPEAYVDERNVMIRAYAFIIQKSARGADLLYVDLLDALQREAAPFSEDGIHPTGEAYARIAAILVRALGGDAALREMDAQDRELLRTEIVKKNALYFHRWRPRNDAFVYGERKDEQPIAQSEPEQFEPFIEEREAVIWDLLGNLGK